MTDTEARVSTALRAELDQIEPSPSSWDVIRNAPTVPVPDDNQPPRAAVVAAAAVIILVVLIAGTLLATTRDGGGDTVVAGEGDRVDQTDQTDAAAGRVVDQTGDARLAHLDLQDVTVHHDADHVEIAWTLAGPVPETTAPVEYRVTFEHPSSDPVVVLARLGGDTPIVAVATCQPHTTRPADCTDQPFTTLTAQPQVQHTTIVVTIPATAIGIPLDSASWTAEVLEPR